jgi:hypothetical protein
MHWERTRSLTATWDLPIKTHWERIRSLRATWNLTIKTHWFWRQHEACPQKRIRNIQDLWESNMRIVRVNKDPQLAYRFYSTLSVSFHRKVTHPSTYPPTHYFIGTYPNVGGLFVWWVGLPTHCFSFSSPLLWWVEPTLQKITYLQ